MHTATLHLWSLEFRAQPRWSDAPVLCFKSFAYGRKQKTFSPVSELMPYHSSRGQMVTYEGSAGHSSWTVSSCSAGVLVEGNLETCFVEFVLIGINRLRFQSLSLRIFKLTATLLLTCSRHLPFNMIVIPKSCYPEYVVFQVNEDT